MWIKREGCEAVNLEFVQSIEKKHRAKNENYSELFWIKFYQIHHNSCTYYFDNKKDWDNFHDNLLSIIGAIEISINKDPLP